VDIHRQQGASLIEALVAVLVVSFGVLGIARFQGALFSGQALAQQRTHAQLWAREKLDEIALRDEPAAFAEGEDARDTPGATLTRRWSVANGLAREARARVEVTWRDSRAQDHRVVLARVLAAEVATNEARLLAAPVIAAPADEAAIQDPQMASWLRFATSGNAGNPESPDEPSNPDESDMLTELEPTKYRISGTVSFSSDAKKEARVLPSDPAAVCGTKTNFTYSCVVPAAWTGSLRVDTHASNKSVEPQEYAFTNVQRDHVNRDFSVAKKKK
jgi:hypothetical protein